MIRSFALSILCAALALPQGAQTGAITGVVRDSTGAVVPNAAVSVINATTGNVERRLVTSSEGGFTATLLTPGTYRLEIRAQGFKPYVANSVAVRINESTRLDAALEVGAIQ